jgi:hypothetical protein
MRFVLMYRPDRKEDTPMEPQKMAALGKMCEELAKAGVVITSAGLQPSFRGARVRLAQGKLTVTDGPFPETKELIAGINLIQVQSREEAIELARRFISLAGDGETEIRQVFEAADFAAPGGPAESANSCKRPAEIG